MKFWRGPLIDAIFIMMGFALGALADRVLLERRQEIAITQAFERLKNCSFLH